MPKLECGSRGLPGCNDGKICVRVPGASCGPETDCGGICIDQKPTQPVKLECGSRGSPGCKEGFQCVKRPGKSCGPEVDCGGICVKSPTLYTGTVTEMDEKPVYPPLIKCGGNEHKQSTCPKTQVCVKGACVGSECYLRASSESEKKRCPMFQLCVQRPRQDGKIIMDAGGVCAAKEMQCVSDEQCPEAFICQKRPNGDGVLCADKVDCGLCAPSP